MCGIVGLFLKDAKLEPELGRLTAMMLAELSDRGPDSAGFAVYTRGIAGITKICAVALDGCVDWQQVAKRLAEALNTDVAVDEIANHAIFKTPGDGGTTRSWLIDNVPEAMVLSQGESIEIFKGVGDPRRIASRLNLAGRSGSHAIGHTRMATESAVTVSGSHPFSTGEDTCLVHNGSLSNHNRLAVLRDPIACKPAVMAEADDWVAFGTEFRALAPLPDVHKAHIWEPVPATVYLWNRNY